ncbi:hypothetical protein DQ04_05531050 [Trypanosoma grayi]|uniref:hypothetical protein n=1 Tax=Trypanosoma grayi TaxID=71804 RepID=UPI0004F42B5F|nr:hypothetical protein DQ04_05531050 [Trypanosoma grayi]KEG09256.1 hypothetical protein DQ04_05531050 [Trypanosoma grayi]
MVVGSEFVAAATAFVENIVAVGACGNYGCLNAFKPSRFTLPQLQQESVPVIPPSAAVLKAAIVAEDFPVGAIGRQLCSSAAQLSVPLEQYMNTLFTAAQLEFGCSLETLLHCLWLVERMQTRNILAQQKGTVALRDASRGFEGKTGKSRESDITQSSLSDVEAVATPFTGSDAVLLSPMPSDVVSVGPLSDGDDEVLCRACARSHVFSLQLWNVQLFVAATLLLSMKINEEVFAEVEEEVLAGCVGAAARCGTDALRCAERCVCEVLWDDLCVTAAGQASVMRRLGVRCLSL